MTKLKLAVRKRTKESKGEPKRLGLGGAVSPAAADLQEAEPPEDHSKVIPGREGDGGDQAKWTHGGGLASRAVTALMVLALLAGPAALVLWVLTPEPVAVQSGGVDYAAEADRSARRDAAEDIAAQWVAAWLTTPAERAEELRQFYDAAVVLPEEVTNQVVGVEAVSAQATVPGAWTVLVAADVVIDEQLVRRYFQVPVSVAGGVQRASAQVVAPPAVVAGPDRQAPTPSQTIRYPEEVPSATPLAETIADFLSGYLTDEGDFTRVVTPGVELVAPAAGFAAVEVTAVRASAQVDVDSPADGEQARVVVDVVVYDRHTPPASVPTSEDLEGGEDGISEEVTQEEESFLSGIGAQYQLTLTARAGRWEVSGIDTGPTQEAQPNN